MVCQPTLTSQTFVCPNPWLFAYGNHFLLVAHCVHICSHVHGSQDDVADDDDVLALICFMVNIGLKLLNLPSPNCFSHVCPTASKASFVGCVLMNPISVSLTWPLSWPCHRHTHLCTRAEHDHKSRRLLEGFSPITASSRPSVGKMEIMNGPFSVFTITNINSYWQRESMKPQLQCYEKQQKHNGSLCPLFHWGSLMVSREPVPDLEPVRHVSTAKKNPKPNNDSRLGRLV